jgi:excisionase family DNA binding protein
MLTTAELAELLGFSPGTIVDWSEEGKLPSFKVGGRLRFRESEVAGWLEERRQGSAGGASANQHHRRPSGVGYVLPTSTTKEEHDAS